MVADLVALLPEFRPHRIVLTADVGKTFLQIAMKKEDKYVLHFLLYASLQKLGDKEPHDECLFVRQLAWTFLLPLFRTTLTK